MDVSLIICTFDRCEMLRRTLASLCDQQLPAGLEWEVIVMDNNSSDQTRQVCAEFGPDSRTGVSPVPGSATNRVGETPARMNGRDARSTLPIRYLFEPRQGKSYALNRAVFEATAEFLVFTDDDVDLAPDWIAQLHAAAQRHPDASFFAGRILPRWEAPPPTWLLGQYASPLLAGVVVLCDEGLEEKYFTDPAVKAKGANLALRRTVFTSGYRFAEDIGPTGNIPTRGEETELMEKLIVQGHKGVYVPSAVVHHRTPPNRMTEAYVREWYRGHGIFKARRRQVIREHIWLGAPRYVWKTWLLNFLRYTATRWTRPPQTWLPAEINFATARGILEECRDQTRRGYIPPPEPVPPPRAGTDASVVIATTDRPAELERCLAAFYADRPPRTEVVVVDASSDSLTQNLMARFQGVRYLRSPVRNLCVQRNLGTRAASGNIVMFVDDDAVPHPGWLPAMLAPFADATVTSVAGAIRQEDTPRVGPKARPGRSWLGPMQPIVNWQQTAVVDVLNGQGGNMAFRKADLLAAGGFDERLLKNCSSEDMDVFLRVRARHGRILYNPQAIVTHQPGPTLGYLRSQNNRNFMFLLGRNNAYTNTKHFLGQRQFSWFFGWQSLQYLGSQIGRFFRVIGNNLTVTLYHVAGRVAGFVMGLRWHWQQHRNARP